MKERRCGRCGLEKPLEQFAWRRIHKGQRDNYCRPCRAAYKQEHYKKHRERYIAQARRRNVREIEKRMRFLQEFLSPHPCVDCGEMDPVVLEFDHLETKSFDVAYGIRNRSWPSVLREIAKCEVVCANCHRRRSAARHGYLRALLIHEESGD